MGEQRIKPVGQQSIGPSTPAGKFVERLILSTVTGQSEGHLAEWSAGCQLHGEVHAPLAELVATAAKLGFDLRVASGFRSFERQLMIWNGKARGERAVFDSAGRRIDVARLDDRAKMFAILRWSALPGTSRHHWGTDLDVWDGAAVAVGYEPQLSPEECAEGGPFCALHRWLDDCIARGGTKFYRPYAVDRGGVAPEPWHLSYRPVASRFERVLSPALIAQVLSAVNIELKNVVIASLEEIFARFVRVSD